MFRLGLRQARWRPLVRHNSPLANNGSRKQLQPKDFFIDAVAHGCWVMLPVTIDGSN